MVRPDPTWLIREHNKTWCQRRERFRQYKEARNNYDELEEPLATVDLDSLEILQMMRNSRPGP